MTINPEKLIATSKFNRFHFWLLVWCFIIILFDGYDLVVYGTVLPILMEEWGLTSVEAGTIGSYGMFGMAFGAILFGTLADRLGRKNVTILSVFLFSFFTMLCGFADNPTMFSTYRFLAGLGLGGVMPNVIALLTDYSPGKLKSMVVSIVLCGYSIGGMLAPILGMTLMPTYGWELIFWVAGIPILFLPILFKLLPESSAHLIRTGRKKELIKILAKVNPEATISEKDEIADIKESESKVPVMGLFQNKRTLSTLMFWTTFFMSLLMVYGLNTWLPNLMIEAGYGLHSSLAFLVTLQAGAIIGTLVIAKLNDRFDLKNLLVILYALGAIGITLLGFGGSTFYIYILVGIAGASTIGAQNLIQAYVSQYYPASLRSTALGMSSGIGRLGGMLGPILGGFLLSISLPIQLNFIAFAIPGLIAAIALTIVPKSRGHVNNPANEASSLPTSKSEEIQSV
ncbi:aromatic acid/H+ symport family MFS transporter [Bacillus sp. B15-48]|uniref:MFS transporter n=1 Tax=Bacillus sp. B15-48 TaxID=1548601 RepID=UPI00193F9EBF|nr:aromatic acid/H+ symport family MFS transporter [Bacillus sp. B15-48]MBM4761339.1 MFS transporter [Bacillus sp. B15-48]